MSFKPRLITKEDVSAFLFPKKDKPEPTVPTIGFDVPKLTDADIVKSVTGNGGPWRSLEDVYRESIEAKRAKRLSDKYDTTPIPEPEFDSEDL